MPLLFIFSAVFASLSDLNHEDPYSPHSISWPNSWVSSQIQADSNYAWTASKVFVYFSVDLEMDISNFYSSISFPGDINQSPCSLSLYAQTKDWQATCLYTFPSGNSFGPVSFTIAISSTGQVIAQSNALGYIGFLPGSESFSSILTVSFSSTSSRIIGDQSSLSFSFTMETQMYPRDYIVLKVDQSFNISQSSYQFAWDLTKTPASLVENSTVVFYVDKNGTPDPVDDYLFFYITITNFIPPDTLFFFTINGWTNPLLPSIPDIYSWKLAARRFGVDYLIQGFTGTGPSDEIVPGGINLVNWTPSTIKAFGTSNSFLIANRLTCYWTLTFSLQNILPVSGYVTVVFFGLQINSYSDTSGPYQKFAFSGSGTRIASYACLLSDQNMFLSVSINSFTMTITNSLAKPIPTGTAVNVYFIGSIIENYITFSSFNAYSPDHILISHLSSAPMLNTSPLVSLLTDSYNSVYLSNSPTDNTEINTFGLTGTYGFAVTLNPNVPLAYNDLIDIYLPISVLGSTVSNTLNVPNSVYALFYNDFINGTGFTNTVFSSSVVAASASVSGGLIKVYLPQATSGKFVLYIGAGSFNSKQNIFTGSLPSRSPSEVILSFQKAGKTFYYTSTFSMTSGNLTPTLGFLCNNVYISGNPATVSFLTPQYSVPSSFVLVVKLGFYDITANKKINIFSWSKLSNNELFPSSLTRELRVNNQDELYYNTNALANEQVNITLPLPLLTASHAYNVKVNIIANYVPLQLGYTVFQGVSSAITAQPQDTTTGVPWTDRPSYSTNITGSVSPAITIVSVETDIDGDGKYTTSNAPVSYLLVLPAGWSTTDKTLIGGTSLSSNNILFPSKTYYKSKADNIDENIHFKVASIQLNADWLALPASPFLLAVAYGSSFTGSCKTVSVSSGNLATVQVTAGNLKIKNYSPSSVFSYTYNAMFTPVVLVFTSSCLIGKNSVIVITANYWTGAVTWLVSAGSSLEGSTLGSVWTSLPIPFDIPINSLINVLITKATLPPSKLTSVIGFISISIKLNNIEYLSWTDTTNATITKVLNQPGKIQNTSNSAVWVHPNVPDSKGVIFGLEFTSTYLIPAGANITITGKFASQARVQSNLWTSHYFTSASIKLGNLSLITYQDIKAQDVFGLVLNNAFDIDSLELQSSITPVLVTVVTGDLEKTTVISDSNLLSRNQVYNISFAPSNRVSSFTYTPSNLAAGFVSWYMFNLTFINALSKPFFLQLQASKDFDPIPGPAFELADYTGSLLVTAKDLEGKRLICVASHWVITCEFNEKYTGSVSLVFSVLLKNGQSSGYFNLFITDKDNRILVNPFYGEGAPITFYNYIVNSIFPYYAIPEINSTQITFNHNLTLQAFVNINGKAKESFVVSFPPPYDLSNSNPISVKCNLLYFNSDGKSPKVEEVIKNGICPVSGNTVVFTLPIDKSFTSNNWTIFTVSDIDRPSTGYQRQHFIYETDYSDYYTENFAVWYQDTKGNVNCASYYNLNPAYSSLNTSQNLIRLMFNNNQPIAVTPGTFSGPFLIESSTGQFTARIIYLAVQEIKTNFLSFEKTSYFSLTYIDPVVKVSVGTNTSTPVGLYYLNWTMVESTFFEQSPQYVPPRITMVQVTNRFKYDVGVNSSLISIPPAGSSIPVAVFISQINRYVVPYSGISVNFSSQDTSVNLTFTPSPLWINKTFPVNFFYVNCSNCQSNTVYLVNVSVGGFNWETFKAPDPFGVIVKDVYASPAVVSCAASSVGSKGFKVSLNSDSMGVMTWCIISKSIYNASVVAYDYLIDNVYIIGSNSNRTKFKDQVSGIQEKIGKVKASSDSYNSKYKFLQYLGNQIYLYDQSVIYQGDNTIYTFDFLSPQTSYVIVAYIDNYSRKNLTVCKTEVTTSPFPHHTSVIADFPIDFNISVMRYQLALFLKWDYYLINIRNSTTRRLSRRLTTANVTIYTDPTSPYDPYSLAQGQASQLSLYVGAILYVSIIDSYGIGKFNKAKWYTDDGIILLLNYSAAADGNLFCTVEEGAGLELTRDQVFLAFNSSGVTIDSYNQSVSAGKDLAWMLDFNMIGYNISDYSVNCIVCNKRPGYPACSDVVMTDYSYTDEVGSLSFGRVFKGFFVFLFLAVVN